MSAQGFTTAELNTLARFEATPAAPESFDPIAALRRVEALHSPFSDTLPICVECSDELTVVGE
jgi:N-formylglutamate amidohydrolase